MEFDPKSAADSELARPGHGSCPGHGASTPDSEFQVPPSCGSSAPELHFPPHAAKSSRAGPGRAGAAASRAPGLGRAVAAVTAIPARRWQWRPCARCCVGGSPRWPGMPLAPGLYSGSQGVTRGQGCRGGAAWLSRCSMGCWANTVPSTTCGSTPHYCARQKDR